MKDTFVEVITRDSLHSLDEGRRFMAVLEKTAPNWLPGKWGHWEPLRREYDPADLEEAWSDDLLLWKGRSAKVEGFLSKPLGPHKRYGLVHFSGDLPASELERTAHVAQDIALAFDGVYGFVHVHTCHEDGEEPHLFVPQFDLRDELRIYWGTILGSPYARLFGTERIASAPAYMVERLGPELFWVQLTERLDDVRTRPDEVAELAAAVKHYLGAGVPEELATLTAPGDGP